MKELYDKLVAAGDYVGDFNQFKKEYGGDKYENLYTQLADNEDYVGSFDDFKNDYEPVKITTTGPGVTVVEEITPDTDSASVDTLLESPPFEINKDISGFKDIEIVDEFKNAYEDNGFEITYAPAGFGYSANRIKITAPNGETESFDSPTWRDTRQANSKEESEELKKQFNSDRVFAIESFISENKDDETWNNSQDSRSMVESIGEDIMKREDWRDFDNLQDTSIENITLLQKDPEKFQDFKDGLRDEIKNRYSNTRKNEGGIGFSFESSLEQDGVSDYQFDKIVNNVVNNTINIEKAFELEEGRKTIQRFDESNNINASQRTELLKGEAIKSIVDNEKQDVARSWASLYQLQQQQQDGTSTLNSADAVKIANEVEEAKKKAEELTRSYKGKNTKFWFEYVDGVAVSRSGNKAPEKSIDITENVKLTKSQLADLKSNDFSSLQESFDIFQVDKYNFENKLNTEKYNVDVKGPQGVYQPLSLALSRRGYKEEKGVYKDVLLRDMVALANSQSDTFGNFDKINPVSESEKDKDIISQGSMSEYVNILAAQAESNQAKKLAYEDVYLLNIDPASIERTSGFIAGFDANIFDIGTTESEGLDVIRDIMSDANIKPTKQQAKNFQKTLAEETGEILFSLPKIGVEFYLANQLTGGLATLSGLNKLQKTYTKANTFLSRTKALTIGAAKEAFTMGVVTDDPVTGAGFAIAGNQFGKLSKILGGKFKGIYAPLNNVVLKPGQAGISFTSASQASSFLKAAADDLIGGEDFKTFMDEKFSDVPFMDEGGKGRELFGEFLTGFTFGASKIKKYDINLLQGKGEQVVNGLLKELKLAKETYTTKVSPDGKKSISTNKEKIKKLEEAIGYVKSGLMEIQADQANMDPKLNAVRLTNELQRVQSRLKKETKQEFDFEVRENGENMGGKPAEFRPSGPNGKPFIIIDASKYKKGMIPHEVFHFVSKDLGLNSPEAMGNLRNIIEPAINKTVRELEGLENFDLKKAIKDTYGDQKKETRPEEYISNVIELLQKEPRFRQALTRGTILGELKQKVTSIIERRFKGTPLEGQKIEFKTPTELLQFLDRLGSDVGKAGSGKQIRMLENLVYDGKRVFDKTTEKYTDNMSSLDIFKDRLLGDELKNISKQNKELAEKNRKITEGKEVLSQADKDALVEINLLKARKLANQAVRTGQNIGLEIEKQVKPKDWLAGYAERLVKLTNTYDPSKKYYDKELKKEVQYPFGAYMNKILPLEYKNILETYAPKLQTQTIEDKQVKDIISEEGSEFENLDLSIGNRKKLSTQEKVIEPISFLTKENQKEGKILENIIEKQIETIDLSKKTYSDLVPSSEVIDAVSKIFAGGSKIRFKEGGGAQLTPEGKPKTFKASTEVIDSQKEFIRENAKELYDMLPYAVKKRTQGLKTSTKIAPVIIRNLYEKGKRADAKTGTTAGLAEQIKPPWSPKVEKKFLELFGANKGAKAKRNQITAINALIRETAKSTLNSVARRKSITEEDIALYQQLADGKSDFLASLDIILPKGYNKERIRLAAGLMALRKDNEAKEKYLEEFEIIEKIRKDSNIIKEAKLVEKYKIEDIAKEYDITTSEAKEKFLEGETSWAQVRAVGGYDTRLKKLKGKTVGGSDWIKTQKLTLKSLIPKGLTFKDLPSDVQSMIYSTVEGGNTRFLIDNGKGKPRPLTYKAWEKELKSKLNIKEIIAPPNKNANVDKGDLIEVVFGSIKGQGKEYENNLNEAKYYSQVSGTKNYIEKLESQGKSPEEAKKLVEKFMAKNEDINATQAINKEILARVYQSYVDQIIKNPSKKTIENLIDTLQPLTNQAQSINKNNIVTTSFALKGETGPTKNKTKRFHNEHLLEFFQLNSNVIKDMRAFVDGKINAETLKKRVNNIVSSAEQAIISEKDRSIKDKTGSAKRDFIDGRVFLGDKTKDQIVIGDTGSFSIAEQISKEVNAKEILRLSENELSTTGVIVKQIVENSKEFKKVEVENKRIADKAGIDVKNLNNTEILEKLKEKDKTNQEELIERYASRDLDLAFNEIIEAKTGIGKEKTYSKAKAAVVGAKSGKIRLLASSAQDFEGLMYRTLAKGKVGETQKKFYDEYLYRPLAQAEANLATDRVTMANNFKALKKQLKVSPKDLRKNIEKGEPWSKEQAIRVYIWNKQGMTIPDISKSDLKLLDNFIKNDPKLEAYAEELILLGKGTPYAEPGRNWEVGTITSDLIKSIQTTKRSQYLAPFISNADIMFSEKNLNKLEAAFGIKYREALENSLARIKAGKNRLFFNSDSGSALENRVLDYINNSTGAIMFFNTRSAVLQTISAANFLNFKENNPLAAGRAFANQPQYWKDFSKLMNSDYLVDRRQGIKLNVAEAEIADAVHDQTNKPKAALNYILRKGFLPTQFADSFAIASGGATFYRNRIKKYVKEGMTEKEAEKKAYLDFMDTAEKSQQSSKAQRISMQQASNLGRVVLAFANTPSQYLRLTQKATSDLLNNRGSKSENISKIAYYSMVQNLLFTTLQQATAGLLFDEDEDNEKQLKGKLPNILSSSFDNLARGAGIAGAALVTAKAIAMKMYEQSERKRPEYEQAAWELLTFSPPVRSKVLKLRSAGRTVDYAGGFGKLMDKGPGLENPAYLAGANVVSSLTNVPLDRVVKKVNNLQAAMDERNATWQRIALIAGWGKWELGIKNKKDPKIKPIFIPGVKRTSVKRTTAKRTVAKRVSTN